MAEQSKKFCVLPFIQSFHHVGGNYAACCNTEPPTKDNNTFYTKDEFSLEEWFYGNRMNLLRNNLLNDIQDSMCDICWKQEKNNIRSHRLHSNKKIEKYASVFSKEDILKPKIKMLDLKFNNECNLACRMCDAYNSNQISKDQKKLKDLNLSIPNHWHRQVQTENGIQQKVDFNEIKKYIPDLRLLRVSGGEPTINKSFLQFIDYCIENNYCKNIILEIATNATKFNNSFIEKLLKFKSLLVKISCDGYKSTYDYIRYPYSWSLFEDRVVNLLENYSTRDNLYLNFNAVPLSYNIENLPKLLSWVKTLDQAYYNNQNELALDIQTHLWPSTTEFSIEHMPLDFLRKQILVYMTKPTNLDFLDFLKSTIENYQPADNNILKKFKQTTLDIDLIRNQNYRKSLEPHTVDWLDSIG